MGGSIKRYMKFVKPYNWQIVFTLFIGIIKFAIPLFIPLLMKIVIDDIIGITDIDDGRNDATIVLLARWNGADVLSSFVRQLNIIDNIMLSM